MIAVLKEQPSRIPEVFGSVYEDDAPKWEGCPWTISCSVHGHINIWTLTRNIAEDYLRTHFEVRHPDVPYAVEVELVTLE